MKILKYDEGYDLSIAKNYKMFRLIHKRIRI